MPVTSKTTVRENGEDREKTFMRFILRPNWFVLAQTEGEPVPAPPVPEWDEDRALVSLGIEIIPFAMIDGNCQGYAKMDAGAKKIALSPIAAHRVQTFFHECAHHVLGHTAESSLVDSASITPRDIREVEAEATAYLCAGTLGVTEHLATSRGYIQHWLQQQSIPEKSISRIFSAANTIIKAGQNKPVEAGE